MRCGCVFISSRQSLQTAISGLISVISSDLFVLLIILNSLKLFTEQFSEAIEFMFEAGGASFFIELRKFSTLFLGPSTKITTPSLRFSTEPFKLKLFACL